MANMIYLRLLSTTLYIMAPETTINCNGNDDLTLKAMHIIHQDFICPHFSLF